MGKLALQDMLEQTQQETALAWHLQYNHYPPVHPSFVETCQTAIKKAKKGRYEDKIKMPNGLTKTVEDIIENLHLEDFLY